MEQMEIPMPRPHNYIPTAEDRATVAQWTRGMLAVYGTIALAFVTGVSATQYLSPAGATAQSSAITLSEPAARAPAPVTVVEPAQPRATTFQVASDTGTSETLAENAWDFNRPETIPGFGPMTPTAPRHAQQEHKAVTAAQEQPGVDIRALLDDPAIRAQAGLAENAWDFNAPDSIPGFASMPPADEPRRIARGPNASEESRSSPSSE
jgi:hypothetical protein